MAYATLIESSLRICSERCGISAIPIHSERLFGVTVMHGEIWLLCVDRASSAYYIFDLPGAVVVCRIDFSSVDAA